MEKPVLLGKIIRDAVHGDIHIDEKFVNIIDAPEFQRLRRIRQLSTAFLVFPTADHTRFSHSLGTFYVMNELIHHFVPIFEDLNLEISSRDINLALTAALLHDIGHGPFSHAFENALPKENYHKKHEQWTIDIVTSPESTINKILIEKFDEKFPLDLADLIKKNREVKKHKQELNYQEIDLFFVLSSLISSQLDADRMDYLLRDAFFTGVSYGKYDISRLINSLTITVYENKFYVCVKEKYLTILEEYLLARYQMHEDVYFHYFKCQTELIVKKILARAYELYHTKVINDNELPEALVSVFNKRDISVGEYVALDDNILISLFFKWRKSSDYILSHLCTSFLDRKKYNKLLILNNTDDDVAAFKKELIDTFCRYGQIISDLDKEYFWLEETVNNETYKDIKDNIWVLKNNGILYDLFKVSNVITEKLKSRRKLVFINMDIIKNISGTDLANDVIDLIKLYNSRNHIEIEKKYFVDDVSSFNTVLDRVKALNYQVLEGDTKQQEDVYYDTESRMLFKSDKTLRIRKKGSSYYLTIKTPTKNKEAEKESQNERFEYEVLVNNTSLTDNSKYILKYLPELGNELDKLKTSLVIRNDRKDVHISQGNVKFHMVFDSVTYINKSEAQDYQIEIELKSEYLHRVNLKILTDYLEKNIPELTPTTVSKYKRGLQLTE